MQATSRCSARFIGEVATGEGARVVVLRNASGIRLTPSLEVQGRGDRRKGSFALVSRFIALSLVGATIAPLTDFSDVCSSVCRVWNILLDVDAVCLCELPGGLARFPPHRESVCVASNTLPAYFAAAILASARYWCIAATICVTLASTGSLEFLDLFDPLVALLGQTSQIVLEAYRAVVCGAIRTLLDAVLVGDSARLILSLAESVAKIVRRMALLSGEWTSLGVAQHLCKMDKSSFNLTAVDLAV